MRMRRRELTRELAERCGISEREARKALNATLETITKALRNWEALEIRGFGRFTSNLRILAPFRCAFLGQIVRERWILSIRFRPSTHLRAQVNERPDSAYSRTPGGPGRNP